METLQIKKDDALKAHENAKSSGKKLLENLLGKKTFLKDVMERIKSVDDAVNELGESDIEVIEYRKLLSIKSAKHILGNQEAIIVSKALNEGWVADPLDQTQSKYTAYFTRGSSGRRYFGFDYWNAHSCVGSRLCLKNSRLARYFGEQFIETHKKYIL